MASARAGESLKRFYEQARVAARAEGFEIQLDGRAVRTPGKAPLVVPARPLADAVAAEWAAQEAYIHPTAMPLTALVCTALDRVRPRRPEVVDGLLDYAETDLLCYRAEHPAALTERQAAVWQPLLDWAALELDAALRVTHGIVPAAQPADAVAALRGAVGAASDLELAALDCATRASSSLVIALALARGRLDAAAAFAAAELDATYQIEQWGEDPEATRRRAAVHADLEAAERLVALLAG